ncbi:hypothetical protein D9M70_497280 [compost metagenome]
MSWPAFMADSILSTGAASVPQMKRSASGNSTPYFACNWVTNAPIVPSNFTDE